MLGDQETAGRFEDFWKRVRVARHFGKFPHLEISQKGASELAARKNAPGVFY
jgi:hypothetical protein